MFTLFSAVTGAPGRVVNTLIPNKKEVYPRRDDFLKKDSEAGMKTSASDGNAGLGRAHGTERGYIISIAFSPAALQFVWPTCTNVTERVIIGSY